MVPNWESSLACVNKKHKDEHAVSCARSRAVIAMEVLNEHHPHLTKEDVCVAMRGKEIEIWTLKEFDKGNMHGCFSKLLRSGIGLGPRLPASMAIGFKHDLSTRCDRHRL